MLVESRGKTWSFGKAKRVLIILGLLGCAGMGALVALLLLYHGMAKENRLLEKNLLAARSSNQPLQTENDMLMAQLSIAEAKIEVLRSERQRRQEGRINGERPEKPDMVEKDSSSSQDGEAASSIAVDDFRVYYDPNQGQLEVEFRLLNILDTDESVSGFIFVVFPSAEMGDPALSLPAVNLEDGVPADVDRGRYFNISNFNIIRFRTIAQSSPEAYGSPTVFVYGKTGELLLRTVFPMEISGLSSGFPDG